MILHGDLFDVLLTLDPESIDACVTDPPYGIGFMGREWDTFKPGTGTTRKLMHPRERETAKLVSENPNVHGRHRSPALSPSQIDYDYSTAGLRSFQKWTERWAAEVFRLLKPGAYIVVCGAPRSYHRMACGLEDAGFVIRDKFAWLFGSGFPKNFNLGDGKGTALKPAHEPIALGWKPFKGTIKGCHETHGTAALNIDVCRLDAGAGGLLGRWPANVLLDADAAAALDQQTGDLKNGGPQEASYESWWGEGGAWSAKQTRWAGDLGGASRFYYVAKPSREERDFGTEALYFNGDALEARTAGEATDRKDGSAGLNSPRAGAGRTGGAKNIHPTVKPVELMRWLVRLVTPPDGVVLDPFTGSGTTGMACRYENRQFIGVERESEYVEIAERRIAAVAPLFGEAAE